jgi:hypothetical protein
MPCALWPLLHNRPVIQVVLTQAQGCQRVTRVLLADTGAGAANAGFELLLDEQDCLLCGGIPLPGVALGGAYVGTYPVYLVQVRILQLGFDQAVPVVGVPAGPAGLDGIACFQFLNRFTYGNFADPGQFELEI